MDHLVRVENSKALDMRLSACSGVDLLRKVDGVPVLLEELFQILSFADKALPRACTLWPVRNFCSTWCLKFWILSCFRGYRGDVRARLGLGFIFIGSSR